MKIIKTLAKDIREELHDAEKYAKAALETKAEHPGLAETFPAWLTKRWAMPCGCTAR